MEVLLHHPGLDRDHVARDEDQAARLERVGWKRSTTKPAEAPAPAASKAVRKSTKAVSAKKEN